MKKLLNFHVKNFCVSRIICKFANSYNNSDQQKCNQKKYRYNNKLYSNKKQKQNINYTPQYQQLEDKTKPVKKTKRKLTKD